MCRRAKFLALVIAFLLCSFVSHAATIRVAKDGTAEHSLIPFAVLEAAPGDTISIGPGVYSRVLVNGPDCIVKVELSELTIIGDDRDTVILDPEKPVSQDGSGPSGIVATHTSGVRVRGLTIRQSAEGILAMGEWVDVQDCRFVGNYVGVGGNVAGVASVRDCEFIENAQTGVWFTQSAGGPGLSIEGCTFRDNAYYGAALNFPHEWLKAYH